MGKLCPEEIDGLDHDYIISDLSCFWNSFSSIASLISGLFQGAESRAAALAPIGIISSEAPVHFLRRDTSFSKD